MKTTIILFAIALVATAASPDYNVSKSSSERVGKQVVTAFKNASQDAYLNLFPTLSEFHQIMDENATIYGNTLSEAKKEFAAQYESEILPAVKESFAKIISEGKEKGIDWNEIAFERIEYNTPQHELDNAPFTIVFSANGIEHRLRIEKAFVLNKEWKVSSNVELI